MAFEYKWHRNEANFGPPVETEAAGGTHISIENILTFCGKYVALRRPEGVPQHEVPQKAQDSRKPNLYFVHCLPIWGESLDVYVRRIVDEQAGAEVASFRVAHLKMSVYEDTQQWAWTPYLFVELAALPVPGIYGNEVIEVVTFDTENIPDDIGWWEVDELHDFIEQHA